MVWIANRDRSLVFGANRASERNMDGSVIEFSKETVDAGKNVRICIRKSAQAQLIRSDEYLHLSRILISNLTFEVSSLDHLHTVPSLRGICQFVAC